MEKIATKLSFQYLEKLEYCNLMLGKRVHQLSRINEELYRYKGDVSAKNTQLDWDSAEMKDNNHSNNAKEDRDSEDDE